MARRLCHEDYTVGWVCALPVEMAAAQEMLDEEHPDLEREIADNDENLYTLGSISGHNVVIVCLPAGQIGNSPAAAVAAQMRATFRKIRFGLMVGIGGGVPSAEADVRLGDVVVSQPYGKSAGVVQYDMGKTTPSGFERTGSLSPPPQILLAAVARVKANELRGRSKLSEHVSKLEGIAMFQRSRAGPDVLFEAAYDHVAGQICDRCSSDKQIVRPPRDNGEEVVVHYGTIASGNQVLRNATERDKVSSELGRVLCFEMEAAGLMNTFPCLVVRGICDYADSHKNKRWQPYAAGTAAAYAKEVLSKIPPVELARSRTAEEAIREANGNSPKPTYCIPFPMNQRFVGRKAELNVLQQRLMVNRDCQALSIVGLGGTGKTQVALQFVYSVKEKWPEYSIFWLPTLSMESFEQACVGIAIALGIQQAAGNKEEAKALLKRYLSSSRAGQWLMVVDNADDPTILFEMGIFDYLPKSDSGVVVYTTRTTEIAVSLTQSDVLELDAMNRQDATQFFSESLVRKGILRDHNMMNKLLDELTCLPLAIAQAAAYLNMNRTTVKKYLELLHSTQLDLISLLSREFRDNTRYEGSANAVATTWVVSFSQLRERNPVAAELLEFLSCIEWKAIPRSLLPETESKEQMENAVGTLCGYSFLDRRDSGGQGAQGEEETEEWYDIHRLVHLATKIWVKSHGAMDKVVKNAIRHVNHIFPRPTYENRAIWRAYLPHALRLLDIGQKNSPNRQAGLCRRIGSSLLKDGSVREAMVWLEKSNHLRSHLSEDNSDRIKSQFTLAKAYIQDKQAQKGITLIEHIVKVKGALEPEDPSRLSCEHALAMAYQENGQIQKGITLIEHVVKIKESLAPDDPSRLASQHELAVAYHENRQVQKAIPLLEHVVKVKEALTPDHPSRLVSQNALAIAYRENRQVRKAIALLEHVVRVQEESLVPDHPSRLASQHALAVAYQYGGKMQEGIALLEYVIQVQEKTLLPSHPDQLASQHELAIAYQYDGKLQEGIALLEHVVQIQEKTLMPEHHNRLGSQQALALAYAADGQLEKAKVLLEHVVAVQARILSDDHLDRVESEKELADILARLAADYDKISSESGECGTPASSSSHSV